MEQLNHYTLCKKLQFMNLPEDRGEDCIGMIINLIQNDLKIDVTYVRFYAVHRVGKPTVGKSRPIIARFMCREDKDVVKKVNVKVKENVKNSTTYRIAYITQDYAKAIQSGTSHFHQSNEKSQSTRF